MLKKGQVGVWDFGKVHEKMVYGHIHSCIVNNMRLVIFALSLSLSLYIYIYILYSAHQNQSAKPYLNTYRFNPTNDDSVYASSSDGTISCIDLETGISLSLMNLNPDGWQVIIFSIFFLELINYDLSCYFINLKWESFFFNCITELLDLMTKNHISQFSKTYDKSITVET